LIECTPEYTQVEICRKLQVEKEEYNLNNQFFYKQINMKMIYQVLPTWGLGNMLQVYASALTLGDYLQMPVKFVTNAQNFHKRQAMFDDNFTIQEAVPTFCIHEKVLFKPASPCYTTNTNCYHFPEMIVHKKYLKTKDSVCIGMTIYSYIAETMDIQTYLLKMQHHLQRVRPKIPLPLISRKQIHTRQCISLHYRHGDNCMSVSKQKIHQSCPDLKKFISHTIRLSSLNSTILISSDSYKSSVKLHEINSNSIIVNGNPIQSIDALSRCQMIVGTVASTFGYVAAYRGNIPFFPVI